MHVMNTEVQRKFPARQLEVDALKHLIHKLRWMGLDEEAENACARLTRLSPAATIFTGPQDTD
ncbi:MAG TPA: hypothetical protein VFI23_07190 [Rhizomicrobium sp.]|nr:hypothetical protein [Rhizomicrobium sp.]